MPESKNKKKKKKQQVVQPSPEKKRISRGQKRYMLASDVKEASESYEAQAQEEAEKAGKRSLWSTVGGIVGAGVGLYFAPAILAAGGVAAGASLATGIGTALITGTGSALGSVGGLKGAKEGVIGDKAERGEVKVDKFFTKEAEEATQSFKDYDKKIAESARNQALVSGALAGLQAGGAFKKVGESFKKGLNIGQTPTGAVTDMSYATKAVAEVPISPVDKQILDFSVANPMTQFTPTANRDLFTALGDYLGKSASQAAIGYGVSKLTGPQQNQIINPNQDIQLPDYS